MTGRAAFTDDEWNLLVRLPRWVVGAASAAQHDNAQRTHVEMEAGFIAVAEGREMGSAFVRDLAQTCMGVFDATDAGVSFEDAQAGLATVLDRIRAAARLLRAKADADDTATYGRWLVAITDVVIKAARSGDKLGFGGVQVTAAEQTFRDQVALAVQG